LQPIIPTERQGLVGWSRGFAIVVLLIAIGVVLFWHLRKRASVRETFIDPDPHSQARQAIEDLGGAGLWQEGRVKEFYDALSHIMRRYLKAVRCLSASQLTTEEIAERLKDEEHVPMVSLLRNADVVKFADATPTLGAMERDIAEALEYIQERSAVSRKYLTGKGLSEGSR
jgi:hypothetical protein